VPLNERFGLLAERELAADMHDPVRENSNLWPYENAKNSFL